MTEVSHVGTFELADKERLEPPPEGMIMRMYSMAITKKRRPPPVFRVAQSHPDTPVPPPVPPKPLPWWRRFWCA